MERRTFLKSFGAMGAVVTLIPQLGYAEEAKKVAGPNALSLDAAMSAITGGKAVTFSPKVTLSAPEIAENGAVVPVKVSVESPMSEKEHVKEIHVLASKNNNVRCADVYLSPANGVASFGTRIKLGGTQDVVAVVKMSDGTFLAAKQNVKVTIGGCG